MLNELEKIEIKLKLVDIQTEIISILDEMDMDFEERYEIYESSQKSLYNILLKYLLRNNETIKPLSKECDKLLHYLKEVISADFEGFSQNSQQGQVEEFFHEQLESCYSEKIDWYVNAIDIVINYYYQYIDNKSCEELKNMVHSLIKLKSEINEKANKFKFSECKHKIKLKGLEEKEKILREVIQNFEK